VWGVFNDSPQAANVVVIPTKPQVEADIEDDAGSGNPWELPLDEYIIAARESNDAALEQYRYGDQFHTPLWEFARLCRAHPQLEKKPDYEAMKIVGDVLEELLPGKPDVWECFFGLEDGEVLRADFQNSWAAVRRIPYQDALSNAIRLAKERPLRPPFDRGPIYQQFVSIAGWLQEQMQEDPILLPCEKFATILRCGHRTVSIMRRFMVKDGLLEVVGEHNFKKHEATTFRFVRSFDYTWRPELKDRREEPTK